MNRSEANTDTMLRKAQTSLISMTRTVSTVVMAAVIFVVGIFIGRATAPALFEKDRTELVLSRIAEEVQSRKQKLDQLRLQTPTPKVNYPEEFQKDNPQAFVPQEKPIQLSVPASVPGPATEVVPKPKAEPPSVLPPKTSTGGEPAFTEKAEKPARMEPPVVTSAAVPHEKPPKAVEPARSAAPPVTQVPAAKPVEMAPPTTMPAVARSMGTASIKAFVYSRKAADEMAVSFRKKGLASSVQPRMTKTGVRYEVTVNNVGSAADASALAGSIRQSNPGSEVVVGH